MSLRHCWAVFRSSSDSRGSKQIRSVDCMISHTLSLVSNSPTGERVSTRNTSRILSTSTYSRVHKLVTPLT